MKKAAVAALVGVALGALPAGAQTEPDLLRFEWVSGFVLQGEIASADFTFDTTPFGGVIVTREGGALDVDPTIWYGLRTNYRLDDRWSLSGSWMHAQADYRVEFPALASDPGNFDLEGLLLAAFDFQGGGIGGSRPASAMSDARTDVYLASVRYEVPIGGRWLFPHATLGGGIFQQKSDGDVIRLQWEGDPPTAFESGIAVGQDPVQGIGVSRFKVKATDWLVSLGFGVRSSISQRWGVGLEFEDLLQLGADYSAMNNTSTPAPDPNNATFFSTTFRGKEGVIHHLGVRLAINYAFWPSSRPR